MYMASLTAIIEKEDSVFIAKCPQVGTVSQGKSVEQALQNLKEATQAYLEEFPQKMNESIFITTFEVKED